ncbi:type IV pilus assembly protein PilM [Pseudomonas fragi]|uniref:type IV pilus assembly protein PilM n=1 Tax=Pseudomonas fragi TaxID=296 RepID=UPI000B4DCC34|nr:type IV pilus assembly protein PilM [Pseudomonas fragi]ASC86973.1 pilus assembly protein PilM [Pseudomonas fragi]
MPGLFAQARQCCIGVDISQQAIKIVELSRSQGRFKLQGYAMEPLPAGLMDDLTGAEAKSVVPVLVRVLEQAAVMARDAIIAVPDGQVICKTLEVEAGLSEVELELHVRLEAEQHIPCALDDMALDFEVLEHLSSQPGRVNVLMAACRQEALEWHRSVLTGAGLIPRVVAVQSHALGRGVGAMTAGLARDVAVAVVDGAARAGVLSIVQQGRVIYSRELAGAHAFKATLVEHLQHELELFGPVGLIVLAGEAAVVPGLARRVESRLGTPTRIANPFIQMDHTPTLTPEALLCDAPLLLTACGLALRGFD